MTLFDRYRLAEAHLEHGEPLAAVETLEPMVDELNDVAAGQLLLGRAYFASAQLRRAQQAFERVVALDPTDDYAHFALGRTFERQGVVDSAITHYRLAAAMDARPEYHERLAAAEGRRTQGDRS